jgi:predicted peroxiredoxin
MLDMVIHHATIMIMSIEHKDSPQKINNYAKLDTYVVERQSRNRVLTSNTKVKVTGVAIGASVIVTLLFGLGSSFAQTNMTTNTTTIYATAVNANPLVYHLSSSDPWRASIALSDANTMRSIGHNVTLLLSIEGVQLGVENPHHHLGLNNLVQNVTDFIGNGGKVVVCKICLEIAGYDTLDIVNGATIATPEITSKILTNATVVDY